MDREYLFSSESVSEGHPDKLADQISDGILDAVLAQDPDSRVACETMLAKNLVVIAGEITSHAELTTEDISDIVRDTINYVGYTDESIGIDGSTCRIISSISQQAVDIARGIDLGDDDDLGAGDQGMMYGYATNETDEYMPLAISLAHRLMAAQAELRRTEKIHWLRPDAKAQVTIRYKGSKPLAVEKVVFSTQHTSYVENGQIHEEIIDKIIEEVIPRCLRSKNIKYLINPTGRFVCGGPAADTGLTGRKIIVDTYGGSCPHGGGAFSGKDPTKVDRSAAYAARYIAKNIVASELADRCTIQLAYAIGVADPVSMMIDLHGTGVIDETKLEDAVWQIFSLKPKRIIDQLQLRRPIYKKTSVNGHFGRELPEFTWENEDKVYDLKSYFNL
jgi:S-adenosylmethionine synthetase